MTLWQLQLKCLLLSLLKILIKCAGPKQNPKPKLKPINAASRDTHNKTHTSRHNYWDTSVTDLLLACIYKININCKRTIYIYNCEYPKIQSSHTVVYVNGLSEWPSLNSIRSKASNILLYINKYCYMYLYTKLI